MLRFIIWCVARVSSFACVELLCPVLVLMLRVPVKVVVLLLLLCFHIVLQAALLVMLMKMVDGCMFVITLLCEL